MARNCFSYRSSIVAVAGRDFFQQSVFSDSSDKGKFERQIIQDFNFCDVVEMKKMFSVTDCFFDGG